MANQIMFVGDRAGMVFSAGMMFEVAKTASARARELDPEDTRKEIDHSPVLTAIVFSAIALEAFMNEVIELAGNPLHEQRPDEANANKEEALAAILSEAEKSKAPLSTKLNFARLIVLGAPYKRGENPFKDLELLLKLRNDLVHPKVQDKVKRPPGPRVAPVTLEGPPILRELESRRLTTLEFDGAVAESATFVAKICTRATARWACNTAYVIVKDLLSWLPRDAGNDIGTVYALIGYQEQFSRVD